MNLLPYKITAISILITVAITSAAKDGRWLEWVFYTSVLSAVTASVQRNPRPHHSDLALKPDEELMIRDEQIERLQARIAELEAAQRVTQETLNREFDI